MLFEEPVAIHRSLPGSQAVTDAPASVIAEIGVQSGQSGKAVLVLAFVL